MPGVNEDCSGYRVGHAWCYRELQWVRNGSCLVLPRIAVGREWVMPGVNEDCSGYRVWSCLVLPRIAVGTEWVIPGVTEDYSG